jgi:hypothetical protein
MVTTSPLIQDQKPGAARRDGHPGIALTVIAACQLMAVPDATIATGRDEGEKQVADFPAEGTAERKAEFAQTQQPPAPWAHEVLAQGISTAFVPAAVMAVPALATARSAIRVRKSDLEALSGSAGPGIG